MPSAKATDVTPTHHATLSDGTTTYGFVLVNSEGEDDERAITRTPVPRTSLKMMQGNTRYADLELPYVTIAQDDWSSGRGMDDFDRDKTRFADSYRLISRHENILMLGPQVTYTTGYRDLNQYMPGKLTWQTLTGSNRYVAYKFTTTAAYTAAKIYVYVRRRGTPAQNLTCELRSDSAGNPGTVLKTKTATTTNITDTVSQLYMFNISDQALTNATAYWVVIYGDANDTASNGWQVGTDATDTNDLTKSSSAGSSWANASYDLYFRVVDSKVDDVGGFLFEYKGSMYCVYSTHTTAPKLYIHGYKGYATGGNQGLTTLEDSSQSFTTDELVNSVIILHEGAGSNVGKVWGTVSSNTGTVITFDTITNTPVADDTLYNVTGDLPWVEITGHGLTGPITDVAVFGDYVYFAQGDSVLIRSMREFNSDGTLTRSYANGNTAATFLKVVYDSQAGDRIWSAANRAPQGRRAVSSSKAEAGALFFGLVVEDCEDVWTAGANVTVTADETDYIAGAAAIKMVVASAASAAQILAYEDLGASNTISMYPYRQIRWWAKSSVAITAGDLQLRLSIASDCSTSVNDFDFPDMEAGVWQEITLPMSPDNANWRIIRSVGVEMVNDKGAFNLFIDAIMVSPGSEFGDYIPLPQGFGRITGLEAYGDPEELWIFREGQVGRIANGTYTPLPLREMSNARSRNNGRASTVQGVYLYFSYLQGLERYYRQNLDDMGPDRDEGLPDARRGPISSLISYPGRIFASIGQEGGARYSSILDYNKLGWHEFYRASEVDQPISNMQIQVVPGWTVDRLWFMQGGDICWLPLPGNTLREDTDTSFRFTHEGTIESGWIYANLQEMEKFYNSLKLITLDTVAGSQEIEADYRIDETSTWSVLPDTFDAFRKEISFTSTSPPNVTGRRLRYRLRLMTDDNTKTPKVKTTVIEAAVKVPVKYTYTMAFRAADNNEDIEGVMDSYTAVETLMNTLDTWANSPTPLTMRCIYSPYDNKEVLLDPSSLRPITVDPADQAEEHVGQLTVIEI